MTRSDKLEEFLAECPNANYGIVTGTISGLVVLDVDGPEGEESLHALKAKYGRLPKTTTVMTGRGYHLYFRLPSRPIRNSAARLGPGLDIRGEGGYVVGPGSVHHSGEVYEYAEGRGPSSVEAAEMPDWLVAILAGDEPEENPAAAQPDIAPEDMDRARRYAEAARQLELDRLRKAPVGQRNETLNRCAFKLGQLVAHELLDANAVAAELAETARLIGLEPVEIGPTIKSGLEKGQLYPRRLPFSTGGSDSAEAAPPPADAQDSLTKALAALGQTDADNAERFARRLATASSTPPDEGS
jgi:putative DNA primase/helicase